MHRGRHGAGRPPWALLGFALTLGLSCSPFRAPPARALAIRPLPAVVTGANLRPVGDHRRGYGSDVARDTLRRLRALGVNTVGILMEGRLADLSDRDVRLPSGGDLERIRGVLRDAHGMGLAAVLIPHLVLDTGAWRGRIQLDAPAEQQLFWDSYGRFIRAAAALAHENGVAVLSLGVELKGLSGTASGLAHMHALAAEVRQVYRGALSYNANWDEAEAVQFWGAVDLIGINAYYPLQPDPLRGAARIADRWRALSARTDRPILALEVGYRASPMSHEKPWQWPDHIDPIVDEQAQARAWAAVLTHWIAPPTLRGLLLWVVPSDPDDPASEPPHGFNPLNKVAESVIRRGFHTARRLD